jgi:hypothetical protein
LPGFPKHCKDRSMLPSMLRKKQDFKKPGAYAAVSTS